MAVEVVSPDSVIGAIAAFVGLVIASAISYMVKKPPQPTIKESVVAGVGLELGSRLSADQFVHEVKRCADALDKLVVIFGDKDKEYMRERMDDMQDGMGKITDLMQQLGRIERERTK